MAVLHYGYLCCRFFFSPDMRREDELEIGSDSTHKRLTVLLAFGAEEEDARRTINLAKKRDKKTRKNERKRKRDESRSDLTHKTRVEEKKGNKKAKTEEEEGTNK